MTSAIFLSTGSRSAAFPARPQSHRIAATDISRRLAGDRLHLDAARQHGPNRCAETGRSALLRGLTAEVFPCCSLLRVREVESVRRFGIAEFDEDEDVPAAKAADALARIRPAAIAIRNCLFISNLLKGLVAPYVRMTRVPSKRSINWPFMACVSSSRPANSSSASWPATGSSAFDFTRSVTRSAAPRASLNLVETHR